MYRKLMLAGVLAALLLAGCATAPEPAEPEVREETAGHGEIGETSKPGNAGEELGKEEMPILDNSSEAGAAEQDGGDSGQAPDDEGPIDGNVEPVQETDEPAVLLAPEKQRKLPDGFAYLDEVLENARYDIRYYGSNNFVGEPIDGYEAPYAIMSLQAAEALKRAEDELKALGYALLVYDAYRPQKAVERFGEWAADTEDTRMKDLFYPDVNKEDVFKLGFLARRSGHSRGSTVDLTLTRLDTGEPLDMGGPYDFFGDISAHGAKGLTEEQAEHRLLLKDAMSRAGFEPYRKEWWHYTLKNEPHPNNYFDFDVE